MPHLADRAKQRAAQRPVQQAPEPDLDQLVANRACNERHHRPQEQ